MQISYSRASVKAISSMDKATKQRIRAAIEKIPDGDITPLKGSSDTYRLRVGGWRIRFLSDDVASPSDLADIQTARAEYARGETIPHSAINWN